MTSSYGGTPLAGATEAPWSVWVGPPPNHSGPSCSGSIVDSIHVLTAAHCVYGGGSALLPPSSFYVYAGLAAFANVTNLSEAQQRPVVGIRVFPYYRPLETSGDLAELEVSPAFDFSAAGVQPIGIVGESTEQPPSGTSFRLFGFGVESDEAHDVTERYLDQEVIPRWQCAGGLPSVLCTHSPSGSPCHGDSGGGLVALGSLPLLVGVTNETFANLGEAECGPGYLTSSADLASPEIHQWLDGDEAPPRAPRADARPTLSRRPVAGEPVECLSPSWANSPVALSTSFIDADTAATLAASQTYVPSASQVGTRISCVSKATNAGGVAEAVSLGESVVAASASGATGAAGPPAGHRGRRRKSSDLAKIQAKSRFHGRWRVVLRVKGALIGRRARVRWSGRGCGAACHLREGRILRRRSVFLSPAVRGARRLRMSLRLPAIGGAPGFRASVIRLRFGHRG